MTRRWTMGAVLAVAMGIAVALGLLGCATAPGEAAAALASSEPADLVIRDVRLFDGERVHDRSVVVVRDGRIVAAGPGVAAPPAAEVVNGSGHTLLPGLIDAHAHTFAPQALEASLAFGVTTVLDMFTAPALLRTWLSEQQTGRATGRSDIISAGVLATAAGGHGTQYGMPIPTVDDAADAVGFVADRLAEGSAFLKIVIEDGSSYGRTIPTLDAGRVAALVEAAHAHDVLAVAHVARVESARMALEAGVDGLVHIWADRTPNRSLVEGLAREGVFVTPTLTVIQSASGIAGGRALLDDDRVALLLDPDAATNLAQSFPTGPGNLSSYDSARASVAALHRAGIRILAGSDAPNPGTTHGASIHRELELLVDAGLSPLEALAAATSVTADAFALTDRGRIGPGQRADLVLVAGDPTADITATRSIVRIWKAGSPFDRDAYAAGVAEAEAQREAARTGPGRGPGMISDFEDGILSAAFGAGWSETTDAIMGGTSMVSLSVEPANGGMALRVTGTVRAGPPFPWSGAMFFPASPPMTPANLGGSAGLSFRARGDGATFQVLLFHEAAAGVPVTRPFEAGPAWAEHVIPWSAFQGADGRGVMGIAFVAMEPGEFELWLDDVALR